MKFSVYKNAPDPTGRGYSFPPELLYDWFQGDLFAAKRGKDHWTGRKD